MDMKTLPTDIFYRLLSHLPIDNRITARTSFQYFDACFDSINKAAESRKSIGIEKLDLSNLKGIHFPKLCATYSLFYRWNCSDESHHTHNFLSQKISSNKETMIASCNSVDEHALLISTLKNSPEIESLDLRGLTITSHLIKTILEYSPQICCVQINFSSFDNKEALDLFVDHLCPKIKHLSMDNLFIEQEYNSYYRIFSNAANLEEAEITIFPTANLLATDLGAFQSEKLTFLSLKFFKTTIKGKPVVPCAHPAKYLAYLCKSKISKNIKIFRIKSNYGHEDNYQMLLEARSLSNITSVHLNFMIYHPDIWRDYDIVTRDFWPHLKHFAFDLYSLRGSAKLLSFYLECGFSMNLKSLIINDCRLNASSMEMIVKKCPNLTSLTLTNITFTEKCIKVAFKERFHALKSLETLRITFTLIEDDHDPTSLRQLENLYRFPLGNRKELEEFLDKHPSIKKVFLNDWPGLQFEDRHKLNNMAKKKDIYLHFQKYN